jgi:hypothetical protein
MPGQAPRFDPALEGAVSSSVPEPGGLLSSLSVLALVRRRRR